MTQEAFHKLVHLVMASPAKPPEKLFLGGMDDWHARARLAHFLAMPTVGKTEEALELFHSVVEADVDEENAEDVEEKVFALQKLSDLERKQDNTAEDALRHIDAAIELAESTDFLYKYILRGELWGDRWNIMHQLKMSKEAEEEVDERIEAYKDIPVSHVSYLYYGYRFKAMDALITNFHLPESTLVMLVSAFASREKILNAYNIAVQERYRFFSFGDAMYIY